MITSKKGFCTKRNDTVPPDDLDWIRFFSMFMLFLAQCSNAFERQGIHPRRQETTFSRFQTFQSRQEMNRTQMLLLLLQCKPIMNGSVY